MILIINLNNINDKHMNLLPDLQIHTTVFDLGADFGANLRDTFGWNRTVWSHFFKDYLFLQGLTVLPTLLRPKSRGSVTLSGPSIHDPPIIDVNFLDHPDDVRTVVEGMKFVKELEKTETFKKYEMHLLQDHLLCGDHLEPFSDAYFECYARELVTTCYHPVGTCAMGLRNKDSVVDHRLRVHGIGKLRVIDASIMPRLVGANTNAACVMIGEKGASMIMEDLKQSNSQIKKTKKTEKTKIPNEEL